MSNSPNMSHCAFENTARAIDQLIAISGAARSERELLTEMSAREREGYMEMVGKMEELTVLLSDLPDADNDQPDEGGLREAVDDRAIGGGSTGPEIRFVLDTLDGVGLTFVSEYANEKFNADLEGPNAGYFEELSDAADQELHTRQDGAW